jgi:hypothetical protein
LRGSLPRPDAGGPGRGGNTGGAAAVLTERSPAVLSPPPCERHEEGGRGRGRGSEEGGGRLCSRTEQENPRLPRVGDKERLGARGYQREGAAGDVVGCRWDKQGPVGAWGWACHINFCTMELTPFPKAEFCCEAKNSLRFKSRTLLISGGILTVGSV